MIYKGMRYRKCRSVGYKAPEVGETDIYGRQLSLCGVAFVRISECRIYEEGGRTYYDPKGVKPIPLSYGATNYGYTRLYKRKLFDNVFEYYRNVYLLLDAKVYVSRITFTSEDAIARQIEVDKTHYVNS